MATNYHECNGIFYKRACDLFGEMKQQQIADMTGLAQGKVSDILSQGKFGSNPNKKPSAETVYKIAKAFNVSTDYLLGLTDYKTNNKATKELCSTLGLSEDAVNLLSVNPNSILANQYRNMIRKSFFEFEEDFDEELVEGETSIMTEAFSYKLSETINWLVNDYIEGVNSALHNDGDYWTERSLIDLLHHFVESLDASENFSIEDLTKGIEKTDNCYSLLHSSFAMKSKDGKKFWVPITMKELLINSAIGEINTRLHNIKYEKLGE